MANPCCRLQVCRWPKAKLLFNPKAHRTLQGFVCISQMGGEEQPAFGHFSLSLSLHYRLVLSKWTTNSLTLTHLLTNSLTHSLAEGNLTTQNYAEEKEEGERGKKKQAEGSHE